MSYSKSYNKYGTGLQSLQWISYHSQANRMTQLINDLDLHDKNIIDIGCGFGDLIPHLVSRSENFNYLGVDKYEPFIDEAKKRYPEFDFQYLDYFASPLDQLFDITLCCGALNAKREDVIKFRQKAISCMYDKSTYCAVFNMSGYYPNVGNDNESKIYYASSRKFLDFCWTLTPKLIFKQQYNPKDFTIYLFH